MLKWLRVQKAAQDTEGSGRCRKRAPTADGAQYKEGSSRAEYAEDADEFESCGKVPKVRQSAGRPWKAQNMQKGGVVGDSQDSGSCRRCGRRLEAVEGWGRQGKAEEGCHRPQKTAEGSRRWWKARKARKARKSAEVRGSPRKSAEVRGRPRNAAEGRGRPRKAAEGRGRPRKAAEVDRRLKKMAECNDYE
eukprot:gene15642-biopygen11809